MPGWQGRRGKRKRASWTLLFRIVRAQFMERGASTEEGGGKREKEGKIIKVRGE